MNDPINSNTNNKLFSSPKSTFFAIWQLLNTCLFLSLFFLSLVILNPLTVESSRSASPTGHSLMSVKQLEGCHKGQRLKGIHEVKQFLMKFGYLHNNGTDANDLFDDLLESAVKKYQANYHLNVTGTLDRETIEDMRLPSCGNPDIINISSSKRKHDHRSRIFHMTSHYNFMPGTPRWPAQQTALTYRFRSTATVAVGQHVLRSVCSRAFKRWEAVSQFTFQEAPQGVRANLDIGFHRRAHGDGASFDGRGRTLAHAFRPMIGMFHYDADENWSENPRSINEIDLESVAVHEIGHLLGLDHSFVKEAIMYRSYTGIKRDLHPNDITGIRALYSN